MDGFLHQCFGANWSLAIVAIGGLVLFVVILRILWKVQTTLNGIDFADWLRGSDGKASWKQAAGIGGFLVGSWCMVYSTLIGKVPDGYVLLFLAYFAICIGSPVALQIVNILRGTPQVPPQQQIRIDAPADANINVQSGEPNP